LDKEWERSVKWEHRRQADIELGMQRKLAEKIKRDREVE
jgi:hypothetical protein